MVSQLSRRSWVIQARIWSLNGSSLDGRSGLGAACGQPRRYLRTVLRAMPVSATMVRMDLPCAASSRIVCTVLLLSIGPSRLSIPDESVAWIRGGSIRFGDLGQFYTGVDTPGLYSIGWPNMSQRLVSL